MKGSGSTYFSLVTACAAAAYLQTTQQSTQMNFKAVIVLRNCPKATSGNFRSFYLWMNNF